MFWFYLRRALHNLRRTPVLTSVMIVDVALGLGVWTLAYTAVDAQTRFPERRARDVYHVDWGTAPEFDLGEVDSYQKVTSLATHFLLPYRDAERLGAHPAVARRALTFTSQLTVEAPTGQHNIAARFATRELFPLFELGFAAGGPWSGGEEAAQAGVVVLDAESERALFGGARAHGRSIRIDGREFRVRGVLRPAPTELRAYDFAFDTLPAIYLPLPLFAGLGARPLYSTHGAQPGLTMAQLLDSQVPFVQLWVELPSERARAEFGDMIGRAARERGIADPGSRPPLLRPAAFARASVPMSGGFVLFEACAFLALLACCVNLSRLLIVKLEARAPELALQRALGATRGSVFAQHLLEALIVGALAIALGLAIAMIGLVGINAVVPDRPVEFAIDASGVALTCATGLAAALFASVFPGMRSWRATPASRLRLL